MILAIDERNANKLRKNIETHLLSGGQCVILDKKNRMVAFNKAGEPDRNDWDWVRKDFRLTGR